MGGGGGAAQGKSGTGRPDCGGHGEAWKHRHNQGKDERNTQRAIYTQARSRLIWLQDELSTRRELLLTARTAARPWGKYSSRIRDTLAPSMPRGSDKDQLQAGSDPRWHCAGGGEAKAATPSGDYYNDAYARLTMDRESATTSEQALSAGGRLAACGYNQSAHWLQPPTKTPPTKDSLTATKAPLQNLYTQHGTIRHNGLRTARRTHHSPSLTRGRLLLLG